MYCSLFYSSECFDTQQNTRKKNIDVQEFVENNMKKAFPVSIDSRNAFIFLVVFFFLFVRLFVSTVSIYLKMLNGFRFYNLQAIQRICIFLLFHFYFIQ